MNTNIILDKLAKTVYNDIVKIFKFRKKGVFMSSIYNHRFLKNVVCRIAEKTAIGYKVLEKDLNTKKVREKVFGFLDFDPEVGCWVVSKAN